MRELAWPAVIEESDGAFVVTFPDFGWGVTDGATIEEALEMAKDALETMVSGAIEQGWAIPEPSPANGRPLVRLSPSSAAKVGLYMAWFASGISKSELARRLRQHVPQVRRLFDPQHHSRLDQIQEALNALGKSLDVRVNDMAPVWKKRPAKMKGEWMRSHGREFSVSRLAAKKQGDLKTIQKSSGAMMKEKVAASKKRPHGKART
jgi:antitoxin HicB